MKMNSKLGLFCLDEIVHNPVHGKGITRKHLNESDHIHTNYEKLLTLSNNRQDDNNN